jgi:hypothetical protein
VCCCLLLLLARLLRVCCARVWAEAAGAPSTRRRRKKARAQTTNNNNNNNKQTTRQRANSRGTRTTKKIPLAYVRGRHKPSPTTRPPHKKSPEVELGASREGSNCDEPPQLCGLADWSHGFGPPNRSIGRAGNQWRAPAPAVWISGRAKTPPGANELWWGAAGAFSIFVEEPFPAYSGRASEGQRRMTPPLLLCCGAEL